VLKAVKKQAAARRLRSGIKLSAQIFAREVPMPDKVKAVPEGFHTLTPHITVRDARRAIDFYQKAFGAEVLGIHDGPEGKIMHATLKIGDSMLMLNDEFPEWGALGPPSTGASGVIIDMYVDNVDSAVKGVVYAGATVLMS